MANQLMTVVEHAVKDVLFEEYFFKGNAERVAEQIIMKIKSQWAPILLYAIEDIDNNKIIFNARGGCYKQLKDAEEKIRRLQRVTARHYRIREYRLTPIDDDKEM